MCTMQNKKSRGFQQRFRGVSKFSKIYENRILMEGNYFFNFVHL